ncbi:MAG TPA: hypothetical protein VNN22_03640 [Verrucomicrobiae bacterium]|nr:hypothetical protein [Verrucomicrobiae bacterium]
MKNQIIALLALLLSGFCLPAQTLSNYQATVNSQSPSFYFTFDGGSLTDATGHGVTLIPNASISYVSTVPDAWGNTTNSVIFPFKSDYAFGGGNGIISGGGTAANDASTQATNGAISFLFRAPDPGTNNTGYYNSGYLCIFSAGSSTASGNSLSLFVENNKALTTAGSNNFPDSLKLRFGNTTQVILPQTSLVPNAWHYFALSYTESTNSNGAFVDSTGTNVIGKARWYLGIPGGALMSGLTTNSLNSMAGDGTDFIIGNETDTTHGFASGAVDEFATWTRQLSAAEITNQFNEIPASLPPPRSTYEGIVTAQSPSYYFKLDGNYVDAVSGTLTLKTNGTSTGLTCDYFGGLTNAVTFFAGGDALTNNGNLLNGGGTYSPTTPGGGKGSISFLFRTLNSYVNQGNRYLYHAGGSSVTDNRFELFFNTFSSAAQPNALKLGFGDSSTTILPTNNFVPGSWYYFAMTYDESQTNKQVTWWLGLLGTANPALNSGTLSAITNSLAGQGNVFIIGSSTNLTANTFRNSTPTSQGRIQDFAIWQRVLAGTEVTNQFQALVTSSGTAPVLSITTSGSNVILAWPSSTDPGYGLQSTTNLTTTSWISGGTASTVGAQFVVTNALSSTAQFYRLKK